MRKTTILMAVAAVATVGASSLSAQAADRKGFYIDIGPTYNMPSNTLTDGVTTVKDTQGEIGGVFGVGFGLNNNKWRLGLQVDYFKTSDAYKNDFGTGTDQTVMVYSAAITYYPTETNNLWFRANLGDGEMKESGNASASGSGFVWGLAAGWDFLLGQSKKMALTPYIAYMDLNKTGDFGGDFSGDNVTGKLTNFQIGVTIGYKH